MSCGQRPKPRSPKDPVCGMSVDPATAKHKAEHGGATYYFCSAGCREKFVAEPARFSRRRTPPPKPAPFERDLHLPDASRDPSAGPGPLPDLRHGARAGSRDGRRGPERGTHRYDRRFWIALALSIPVVALEMGGHLANLHMLLAGTGLQLDSIGARDAGRAVGGMAVLRARLGVAQDPQPQHVHADRDGHRRGLGVQRRRDRRAGRVSAGFPRRGRRGRGLFRSGGGDHRARVARTGARAPRARTDRRRYPRASRSRAKDCATHPRGRRGRGCRARSGCGRRSPSRAPGREGSGRRRA